MPITDRDQVEEATENLSQEPDRRLDANGQRDPRDSLILVIYIGLAGAAGGYLLKQLASAFPPDAKTLARDAAICGFIGAIFVVDVLIRRVIAEIGQIVLATLLWGFLALAALLNPNSILQILAVVVGGVLFAYIADYQPTVWTWFKATVWVQRVARVGAPLLTYGLILLGVALLTLALFLQLRSIDLSHG